MTGEAGIGKSRVIEALQQELAAEAHARINLQCSPYHSDSALYPVIQYLNRAAGFAPADPPDVRTEKLRGLLGARHIANPAALPLLAELLSIPLTEAAPAALPAQRKAATLALIVEIMTRTSDSDPVLIVLEDAHWIDATTLEMMTRMADSITRARLLVVVSARPDSLLEAVAGKDNDELEGMLAKLVAAGLCFPRSLASSGASTSSTRWCVTPPMKACC